MQDGAKKYVLELLRNDIYVFPIKGRGADVGEAKRPLTFKENDELITWKNEKILAFAEELARRGHGAWAVWLKKSKLFGVDVDVYKSSVRLVPAELAARLPGFYVERTGRGGIHVVMRVLDSSLDCRLTSTATWVEYKHDGYFIIWPTVLRTRSGVYRYVKVSERSLLDVAAVVDFDIYSLEATLNELTGSSITLDASCSEERRPAGGGGPRVAEDARLKHFNIENVDSLTDKQLTALLYLLFAESDCSGLARIVEDIYYNNICKVYKETYAAMKIVRTTRWLIQYVFAAVLALVGASAGRVADWLQSWKFIDEDSEPRRDSLSNAVYNVYKRGQLNLVPAGACPFCSLANAGRGCDSTPVARIKRLTRRDVERIVELVREKIS